MTMPRLFVSLALLSGLAVAASAEDKKYAHVSLREIRHNATAYKSTLVAFKVRLNKAENLYAPFYTPFTPDRYLQVSVWGPESRIFVEKDRLDLFPQLFAKKDKNWVADLMETHRYSWIYVWGEVVNDFNDSPWIDIHSFEVLSEKHFRDSTLGAAIRGYEAFEAGDMEGAMAEFVNIPDYSLPRTDRFHCTKMRAQAAWALGKDAEARTAAIRGLRIRPGDATLATILEGTAPRALPGEEKVEEDPKPEGGGDDKGEDKKEGGSLDRIERRLAALEKENAKLKLELEAAREELAMSKEMPRRVASDER